ncbi:hypothetical protein ACIRJO_02925 [Streptomyces sp. NPDC102394]|uniref:hypothetical protein n=1 Tax=Streptomyces sp. NPDC102394 TaxID=3366167 RepID=UPI0037FF5053
MSTETTSRAAAHCGHCDQDVQPVEKRGWVNFLAWLALLEFGSVIAAVVDAFHPLHLGTGIGRLVLWPTAVHPTWLAVLAAAAAFLLAAALTGSASRRAAAKAVCPKCRMLLKTAD